MYLIFAVLSWGGSGLELASSGDLPALFVVLNITSYPSIFVAPSWSVSCFRFRCSSDLIDSSGCVNLRRLLSNSMFLIIFGSPQHVYCKELCAPGVCTT